MGIDETTVEGFAEYQPMHGRTRNQSYACDAGNHSR
jgi:hypothetical protein